VRRGQAGRLVRDSSLKPNERFIMLVLLDRANNDDCTIPAWCSPSLQAVEHDTGLAHSTVVKSLAHLEMHLWLAREGQKRGQVAKTKGSGRGRTATRWTLMPDGGPLACNCPKPDRPSRDQSPPQIGRGEANLDRPNDIGVLAGQVSDCTEGSVTRVSREGKPWRGENGDYLGGPVPWGWPGDSVGAEVNEH
jgi:hypothetical protein